jgi:hypothetical protein
MPLGRGAEGDEGGKAEGEGEEKVKEGREMRFYAFAQIMPSHK